MNKKDYKQILKKILKYNTIIIHGHIRPDGDCIGSQIGLKEILKENFKKNVYVVGDMSDYVSFLGNMDQISDELYADALAIVVDCGDKNRVSDKRFINAKECIKIDHHIPVDSYGTFNYVDENSPACAQLITEFALVNKLKINHKAATSLYVGISTDTGRFKYQGVNEKTFYCCEKLINLIDLKYIDQNLSKETMREIKLKGYIYSNLKTTKDGVSYFLMTKDIMKEFDVTEEEASSMVNTFANIENYPTWFLLIEYDNELRLRIRSIGPEVDKLANKYDGGGHKFAAGAKLKSLLDLPMFLEDINNLVKEYKENEAN